MAKASGLAQVLLVGGYDLSGDVGSLSNVGGGPALLDVTGIDKSAMQRIGGIQDGRLDFMAFFNDASNQAHPRLRALASGADVNVMYLTASTLGNSAAGIVAKQFDYAGTRAADGAFTFNVPHAANGFALEWGSLLTAGKRTDTAATNGTSIDMEGAATTTGWSAYLQVTAFSGTDVTVTIQDSADNAAFAGFTSSAFTQITSGPTTERIAGAAGATVRRYVRVITSTTGGFTSLTFAVLLCRHPVGATA